MFVRGEKGGEGGGGGGRAGALDSLQIYKGEKEKVVHNMLHDQQPQ